MRYLYIVATNKEVLVTVRIAPRVRDEFKKAAELRGATMSGLLHQFIVRTIREERAEMPHAFEAAPRQKAPVVASISGNAQPTKGDIQRMLNVDDEREIDRRLNPRKRTSVPQLKQKAK